jgi:hypothetical protein
MQRLEAEQRIKAEEAAISATATITEAQRAQAATRVFTTSDRLVALASQFAARSADEKLSLRERAFASATASRFFSAASDVALRMSQIGGAGSFYRGAEDIAIQVVSGFVEPGTPTEPPAQIKTLEDAERVIRAIEEAQAHPTLPYDDWNVDHPDASPIPPQVAPDVKAPQQNALGARAALNARQDHRVPSRMDNVPLGGGARLRYRRVPFESNGPGDFEEIGPEEFEQEQRSNQTLS